MSGIRVTAFHRIRSAWAMRTRGQQFGLLAWVLQNPKSLTEQQIQQILLFSKSYFPDPKAEWLAKEILVRGCDLEVIEKDAMRAGHHAWYRLFIAAQSKSEFARPPEIALKVATRPK